MPPAPPHTLTALADTPRPEALPASPVLVARPGLVVCDECDAVHARVRLARGHVARCQRCHALLGRGHVVTAPGQLAIAVAALVFLLIGNLSPLVLMDLQGIRLTVTMPHAISLTWRIGQPLVAVLATATALVFPAGLILLRLYVLGFLVANRVPPQFRLAMRALRWCTYWSMVEVFMLSALVALVRSAGVADLVAGVGLFAWAALTLLLTSITASGTHSMWKRGSELGAG
jgi:paraquat-inducible protein A